MNDKNVVIHHSFEEAAKFYDQETGLFVDCKDDSTGEEYPLEGYPVYTTDGIAVLTADKALEEHVIQFPSVLRTVV